MSFRIAQVSWHDVAFLLSFFLRVILFLGAWVKQRFSDFLFWNFDAQDKKSSVKTVRNSKKHVSPEWFYPIFDLIMAHPTLRHPSETDRMELDWSLLKVIKFP